MTWLVSHPEHGRPVTHAFATEDEAERAATLLVRRGGTAVVWEMDDNEGIGA